MELRSRKVTEAVGSADRRSSVLEKKQYGGFAELEMQRRVLLTGWHFRNLPDPGNIPGRRRKWLAFPGNSSVSRLSGAITCSQFNPVCKNKVPYQRLSVRYEFGNYSTYSFSIK
jgi:hypothetical protein